MEPLEEQLLHKPLYNKVWLVAVLLASAKQHAALIMPIERQGFRRRRLDAKRLQRKLGQTIGTDPFTIDFNDQPLRLQNGPQALGDGTLEMLESDHPTVVALC